MRRAPPIFVVGAVVASALAFTACPDKSSADKSSADKSSADKSSADKSSADKSSPADVGTDSSSSAAASDGVFARVQAQLGARLEAVHDYDVGGNVVAADGQQLRFRYAMQQPTFMAGELLDEAGVRTRAFVFDGKVLAVIDDATKTVARHDLSGNEEQLLLTLHQTFSSFVCEGWRPPLLRPTTTVATVVGDTVELVVPINAEGLLRSVVVVDNNGAFVSKRTVADGEVVLTSTTVLASAIDAATTLKFPTSWAQVDGDQRATTTLSTWVVNGGIAAERFSTAIPAGFTAAAPPTP